MDNKKYTIHFETLGCRLNQDESEGAARSFLDAGFSVDMEGVTARTPVSETTVLSVINTCTVTSKAEQKARRLMRLLLEKYPKAPLLVTGCYAQLDKDSIEAIDARIVVLSGTKKYALAPIAGALSGGSVSMCDAASLRRFVDSFSESKPLVLSARKSSLPSERLDSFTLYTPLFVRHSRSSVKVQDGCNNSCTFCRIHLARGKSVSLEAAEVLRRVKELEEAGSHEVVFTGVNLSQYAGVSPDGAKRMSFAELLDYVIKNTSHIKIRISSLYPQHVDDELCAVLSSDRIQPFFHLSVQSGSDSILRAMGRPYDSDLVRRCVANLRRVKDNPFISCDIIAGFPGESEEDFNLTMKLCGDLHFAWVHAFPYSPRPGTVAKDMADQVSQALKNERVARLTRYAVDEKLSYIRAWKGRELPAVVENTRSQRLASGASPYVHAVTSNYIHVRCECDRAYQSGDVVTVVVEDTLEESIVQGREEEACARIVDR